MGARVIERLALRRRLIEAVERHLLTLIIAPPVSGKATLIAQITEDLASRGVPVAADLGVCADARVVIMREFDRASVADQSAAAKDIERALEQETRIVISASRPLSVDFPRARLRNEVREFRLGDLALRQHELAEFLGAGPEHAKAERDLRSLYESVGGWIGAWNLIKARAERGETLSEIARTFSGAAPEVRAYFDQLIMPTLEPAVRDLVMRVGMLDRVSPGLADAITGRCDGLRLLELASAQCAFLEVEPDGVTHRLPKLLRDYVRHCGWRDDPTAMRERLERAAEWTLQQQDWLRAAQLYMEINQPDRTVEILAQHTDELITGRGEVLSFRAIAFSLSKDARYSQSLAFELALSSIFAGDFAQAEGYLAEVRSLAGGLSSSQRIKLEAAEICIDFGFERFDRVIEAAPRWLEQHPQASPRFRAIAAVSLFWSATAQLKCSDASRALAIARTETTKTNSSFLEAWLSICSAAQKLELGQVAEADAILTSATTKGLISHTMNLIRAAIAWEQGDEPRARQLTAASLRQGVKHSVVETAQLGWHVGARIATRDRGLAGGLRLLDEAEVTMAARHGERARRLIRLMRAKLILQTCGGGSETDVGAVELERISAESHALGLSRSLDEAAKITLARYLTLRGAPKKAISLLQPILQLTQQQNRLRPWGEASLIYAGALARQDEVDRASRMVWRAAGQLIGSGMGATIWEEEILLAPILDDLLARASIESADRADVRRVFRALATRSGRTWRAEASGREMEVVADVELTGTERQLLTLVAQGLSNSEVAEQLMVKVSTVKWHLHNIFGKLEVRSRTAALAEARRLGLLL